MQVIQRTGFALLITSVLYGCQSGLGINPCLEPAFKNEVGCQHFQSEPVSAPMTPSERASPSLTPFPTLSPSPSPLLPTSAPVSVIPTMVPSQVSDQTDTPSQITRLSLGPSRYTFSQKGETFSLIWFAETPDRTFIQDPTRFEWRSTNPEIFEVENGRITAVASDGFATIILRDPVSGLEARMQAVFGRGGGSVGRSSVPQSSPSMPQIDWLSPANNTRFLPGQNISLVTQILQSTSDRVRFVDQNGRVVSTGNETTVWENALPAGTFEITAELLDDQNKVLARSAARTLILDNTGLTAYYSNTSTDKIYTLNYRVDSPSFSDVGAITDIPGARPGFPSPGGSVDAIAKHPINGRVYYDGGSGGNKLYYWEPREGTGENSHHFVNPILSGGSSRNLSMMTFQSQSAELFGFGSTGGNRELFRINLDTAEATTINLTLLGGASLPTSGDMAFNKDGTLFMSSGNRLYRIVFQNATEATFEQLPSLQRQDDGTSVGSVSSLGFDGLNRGYLVATKNAAVRLYQFDSNQPANAIELRNLSAVGEALAGETSSAGDMTSTHGFLQ